MLRRRRRRKLSFPFSRPFFPPPYSYILYTLFTLYLHLRKHTQTRESIVYFQLNVLMTYLFGGVIYEQGEEQTNIYV